MAVSGTAQEFGTGLAGLLKEYTAKMRKRVKSVELAKKFAKSKGLKISATPDGQAMQMEFQALESALFNLTREASQLAEQGKVDDLTRVELRLRLAELEGLLHAYRVQMHS